MPGEWAEDALKKAKASKNYEEFGLLAEKVSEDDWRVTTGHQQPPSTEWTRGSSREGSSSRWKAGQGERSDRYRRLAVHSRG